MSVLRTPDERFNNLPDFPFTPNYLQIGGLRIHYIDEGRGEIILCLHGEPTWSFLYRKMIPILAAKYRVIAMDFVGFGRSDKFADKKDYSFRMHTETLADFIKALNLKNITLVVHDWGGLIGLPLACRKPEAFGRLVILNTGLPTAEDNVSEDRTNAFLAWRQLAETTPDLSIEQVIRMGTAQGDLIPPEVIAGYEAPFPDITYKAGASIWPLLVPIHPGAPGAAEMRFARDALSKWQKPALVMFSDGDPITSGGDRSFRKLIPSARKQPHIVIKNAGHFLQEDKGELIAKHILNFMARTSFC